MIVGYLILRTFEGTNPTLSLILSVLLGCLLGRYCKIWILAAVTFLELGYLVYIWSVAREIEAMIAMILTVFEVLFLVPMWLIYIALTKSGSLSAFASNIGKHIFREN